MLYMVVAPGLEGSSQLYEPVPISRYETLQHRAHIHRTGQICEESRVLWFGPRYELEVKESIQVS